jgi:hypothetical protein
VQTVRRREKTLAFAGIQIYPGKKAKGGNISKLFVTALLPVSHDDCSVNLVLRKYYSLEYLL